MQTYLIVIAIVFSAFFFLMGWLSGNTEKGFMVNKTNELPKCLYTVIYTDKVCTVIREIGPKKRNFLITTEAFGGLPIRPKDTVRVIKDLAEMQELGIKSLGYPPFVKEAVVEEIFVPTEEVYAPETGTVNRYQNCLIRNKSLADEINTSALNKANYAMPVLEKIEQNPELKSSHHERAGSKWMGEFLRDKHREILDLYGVAQDSSLKRLHEVPSIVINFLERTRII